MQNSLADRITASFRLTLRSLNPLHFAHAFQREIYFILVLGLTAFYYLALASFSPLDASSFAISLPVYAAKNLAGETGAFISGGVYYVFGLAAWCLPLPLLMSAALILRRSPHAFDLWRFLGWVCAVLCLTVFLDVKISSLHLRGYDLPAGGWVGSKSSQSLLQALGSWGALTLLVTLGLCAALLILRRSLLQPIGDLFSSLRQAFPAFPTFPGRLGKDTAPSPQSASAVNPIPIQEVMQASSYAYQEPSLYDEMLADLPTPPMQSALDEGIAAPKTTTDVWSQPSSTYAPPPLSLFQGRDSRLAPATNPQEIEATAQMLVKTFEDFGVQGQVIGYQPGPVVTVYEYQPDAGIKQSKLIGLIDDLALALKVDSIFIHPVQGKRALGVQVPNSKREAVFLGDIINTTAFRDSKSPLTFALGKTINGQPMCADLATMPHLLVAGATGSGKSVCINTMLCSVIMKAKPQDVRMILVDPKMLELSVYEGIPHLLMPVITEPTKASMALKWAANEMEQRYKLMQHACVRNIDGFNQFWDKASEEKKQEVCELAGLQHTGRLPYILLVIDELADLMMTAPKDVESSIQRLAQKARASGIHMVLATQRPSVDIITGVIKANLPCRVAFQVVSKHDSRTILDLISAEKLLGKGDMLLQRPGIGRLERLQGALITDEEVINLVAAIKVDGRTHYDQTIMSWIDEEVARQEAGKGRDGDDYGGGASMDDDPKWDEAIHIARTHGVVSASFLQRHLKIGYNRAARIVEFMESQNLVDKADGAKPRKWLGPSA